MKKFLLAAFAVFLAYAVPTTTVNAYELEFALTDLQVEYIKGENPTPNKCTEVVKNDITYLRCPMNEMVKTSRTVGSKGDYYTIDVPHDVQNVSIKATWNDPPACSASNRAGCGINGLDTFTGIQPTGQTFVLDPNNRQPITATDIYSLDPRKGFLKWVCPNCGCQAGDENRNRFGQCKLGRGKNVDHAVTRNATLYKKSAVVYYADSKEAKFGVPSRVTKQPNGLYLDTGGHIIPNGSASFVEGGGPKWRWLIINFKYEIHFDYFASGWYWLGTSTIPKTYRYAIKIKRAADPSMNDKPKIKVDKRAVGWESNSVKGRTWYPVEIMVKLDRASTETITVDWATEDQMGNLTKRSGFRYLTAKPATAGSDYTAANGTLIFAPGERKKTIRIEVLNDTTDEGGEYFKINYTNPQGAEFYKGRDFTWGIIWNDGPLPGEYLSKFGHTVGGQIVDAISNRVKEDLKPGADIAGVPNSMIQNQLLPGSNFSISDSNLSIWGTTAYDTFDGDAGGLDMSGSVLTATLATDIELDKMLLGLAVHFSKGRGKFGSDVDDGKIESTLTTFTPYARYNITKNLLVWGLAGYGFGKLEIGGRQPLKTDISMLIGAAGARGELLNQEDYGLDLALKTDAFYVRMKSDKAEAVETTTNTYRFRVGLEGSRRFEISQNSSFRPHLELGFRYDGGDIDSGFGVELKGGGRLHFQSVPTWC